METRLCRQNIIPISSCRLQHVISLSKPHMASCLVRVQTGHHQILLASCSAMQSISATSPMPPKVAASFCL